MFEDILLPDLKDNLNADPANDLGNYSRSHNFVHFRRKTDKSAIYSSLIIQFILLFLTVANELSTCSYELNSSNIDLAYDLEFTSMTILSIFSRN